MGMTITITVEEQVDHEFIRASHMLTDTEIDYAAFDIIGHTVSQLRQEVADEVRKYASPNG
jgi:hypothetical protein